MTFHCRCSIDEKECLYPDCHNGRRDLAEENEEPTHEEVMRNALDRIANMKNRDGVEIEMHREEVRAIARTALRSNY